VKENTLIVITGPTAIGKTSFAIEIAQHLGTEIISCDSRQIYSEIRIGTARPSDEQLAQIKHHFIACKTVYDYYNASMFEIEVLELLNQLFRTNKTVVMVGGSGLYVDAVCKGIDDLPTIEPEIRENILKRYNENGIETIRQELLKIDPEYCRNADIRNPKRIFKALEVFYMTGKPYSTFLTKPQKERGFNIVKIGLNRDRKELYNIIDKRVDMMMKDGLLEEVEGLTNSRHLNALNTVGYKELFDYIDGSIELQEAINLIKQNTRRYAKRQITWFNRDKDIKWFHPEDKKGIFDFVLPRPSGRG
jgi:tRNA dimethylallyltransferase